MTKELDDRLVKKYPKIFADRYKSMQETAMCWGFDHGDGWYWILDELCNSIQSYIDNNPHKNIPQVVATQVKEKFGILNFYYIGGDEYIAGMVHLAERMSWHTCEVCGSTKNIVHTKGWIKTRCKSCLREETRKRPLRSWYRRMKWRITKLKK